MRGKETGGKVTGSKETGSKETGAKETGGEETGGKEMEEKEVVIEGVRRRGRVFVGDSIVRKIYRALNKGDYVMVYFVKIEAITERVENVGPGNGGSILLHIGTNNVEREGTTAILRKYTQLVRRAKQTRVEQIILSRILPVKGSRIQGYRNCRRMAINNTLVQQRCSKEEVGFVDLWGCFVGRADIYMKDGLKLGGKGATVCADELSAAVESGMGSITNYCGRKHYLNEKRRGLLSVASKM